jgi:AraC family transcriptional regulator
VCFLAEEYANATAVASRTNGRRMSTNGRESLLVISLRRHQTLAVTGLSVSVDQTSQARWGLRVERLHTGSGEVALVASRAHRLRLHVGRPVQGTCSQSHRFSYTRGDIDLLPAGFDDVCVQENATTSLMVELSPRLLRDAAEDLGLPAARAELDLRHQLRDKGLELIVLALEIESSAGHASGPLYSESLGLALSARVLGMTSDERRPPRGLSSAQRARLVDYIEAHLDEPLSLKQLARLIGSSASHLKTLFKRSLGVSVHAYVVERRVERARQLLREGKLPSAQVALESGFAHQSHMARCIRRLLGVSPTDLRGASAAHG